jgi:hypothetical protein
MASSLNLTRDQLATFLKDPQQIRQFERLFGEVNGMSTTLEDAQSSADSAQATANEALALLDRVAQALEALTTAPADVSIAAPDDMRPVLQFGTIVAQNADNVLITGGTVTATLIGNQATLARSSVALTNGAAAAAGTLLNAPAAGNPTKWVPIDDNGTIRYVPAW